MPYDPNFYLSLGGFALASVLVLATASLNGWRDWIALKHAEMKQLEPKDANPISAASRIDVADLKERVRKLEAIAAGIDV
jgi:hypothetical protein